MHFPTITGTFVDGTPRITMTTLDAHDFAQPSQKVSGFDVLNTAIRVAAGGIVNVLGGASSANVSLSLTKIFSTFSSGLVPGVIPSAIFYDEFYDPNVTRWSNVGFADNYFQKSAEESADHLTFTPNGRAVDNADINVALSGN